MISDPNATHTKILTPKLNQKSTLANAQPNVEELLKVKQVHPIPLNCASKFVD